jgi:alpha-beta hydrolase superfamily lysophospholipase
MKTVSTVERVAGDFVRTVHPRSGADILTADWVMPVDAKGLVLFAHGSGSGRHSQRNRAVALYLQSRNLGTLLLDLLTPSEEAVDTVTAQFRFDIPLLARRLIDVTRWVRGVPEGASIPLAYFGASTGAAAALIAAATIPEEITSVVSRGGRPDLAGRFLAQVAPPTLLLVGGEDREVLELNRKAMQRMRCPVSLIVIPGATHLFEEPGKLEQVATRATDWFLQHVMPEENTEGGVS